MILAEWKPTSARVFTAVIFLVRFWIQPKMNINEQSVAFRLHQNNHLK
jgi:hypothetical protein